MELPERVTVVQRDSRRTMPEEALYREDRGKQWICRQGPHVQTSSPDNISHHLPQAVIKEVSVDPVRFQLLLSFCPLHNHLPEAAKQYQDHPDQSFRAVEGGAEERDGEGG
jgi:hypothetical protein